jgi:hypothetical protein
VSGTDTSLAIEICSGPLDGTGVQVSGGAFTVGYDQSCDVALPETPGTPSKAEVHYSVEAAGLKLESECDVEHEGATTRTVEGTGGTLIVRVGATDLGVAVTTAGGPPGAPASSDAAAEEKSSKKCPKCGWGNAPGARWCANCGRDL